MSVSGFNAMLDAIQSMLGVDYVWGGTDPKQGVDCSGFVQNVYRAVGIELPRVSADQARSGQTVSMADARPGDLLSWDLNGRNQGADHVGIYLGNGKVAEASSSQDKVVIRKVWGSPTVTRVMGAPTGDASGLHANSMSQGGVEDGSAMRAPISTQDVLGTTDVKAAFGQINVPQPDEESSEKLNSLYALADLDDSEETPDTIGPAYVAQRMYERQLQRDTERAPALHGGSMGRAEFR